jgi:ParB-like chromosome segregation protein Spo0J
VSRRRHTVAAVEGLEHVEPVPEPAAPLILTGPDAADYATDEEAARSPDQEDQSANAPEASPSRRTLADEAIAGFGASLRLPEPEKSVTKTSAEEFHADLSSLMPGYLPLDTCVLVPGLYGRPNGHGAEHIAELAESIFDIGQQVPVEFVLGQDGSHLVTKGSGRIAAMLKLREEGREWPGGPHVKAQLGNNDDLAAAFISGAQENIHRDNLGPEEMVAVIGTLRNPPFNLKTDAEIATRLRVKRPTITQYSLYARRIPEIRKAVSEGRMSFKASRHAPKKPQEQLKWFRGLEKKAAKRGIGQTGRKSAAGKVTASMAEKKPRKAREKHTNEPVLTSGDMIRKDLAADFKGIVRSYCKTKTLATCTILNAVARYLEAGINGKELANEIEALVASKPAALPGNKEAKKRQTPKT